MTLNTRQMGIGVVALLVLLLLSWVAAPQSSQLQQGSTYSRAPAGYGAWFAYMEQQQTPLQRWRRPLDELVQTTEAAPITLLRIQPNISWFGVPNDDWIRRGNVLVLLGIRVPVTDAPFRSTLASPAGGVTVETSRRYAPNPQTGQAAPVIETRLGDTYGAVVWQKRIGQGHVIYAATPYLAANAYQDQPGNFRFLEQLVTEPGHSLWVDEYLHGYRDPAPVGETVADDPAWQRLIRYFAATPLAILIMQAVVLLLLLVWGQNCRFGALIPRTEPKIDNSTAYIQALASVLQKANAWTFVAMTIGRAEQLRLQRALGLGPTPLEFSTVAAAWERQTGRSAAELEALLQPQPRSESELLTWLRRIQTLRRQLE